MALDVLLENYASTIVKVLGVYPDALHIINRQRKEKNKLESMHSSGGGGLHENV